MNLITLIKPMVLDLIPFLHLDNRLFYCLERTWHLFDFLLDITVVLLILLNKDLILVLLFKLFLCHLFSLLMIYFILAFLSKIIQTMRDPNILITQTFHNSLSKHHTFAILIIINSRSLIQNILHLIVIANQIFPSFHDLAQLQPCPFLQLLLLQLIVFLW